MQDISLFKGEIIAKYIVNFQNFPLEAHALLNGDMDIDYIYKRFMWLLWLIFAKTTVPNSTKNGTKHPWLNGI